MPGVVLFGEERLIMFQLRGATTTSTFLFLRLRPAERFLRRGLNRFIGVLQRGF